MILVPETPSTPANCIRPPRSRVIIYGVGGAVRTYPRVCWCNLRHRLEAFRLASIPQIASHQPRVRTDFDTATVCLLGGRR